MQGIWKLLISHYFCKSISFQQQQQKILLFKIPSTFCVTPIVTQKIKCYSSSVNKTLKQLEIEIPRKGWVLNEENYEEKLTKAVNNQTSILHFLNRNNEYCMCFFLILLLLLLDNSILNFLWRINSWEILSRHGIFYTQFSVSVIRIIQNQKGRCSITRC